MFTGLVKELGTIRSFNRAGNIYRLEVDSAVVSKDAAAGDSVAVNGACLTLVESKNGRMAFDVMEETVRRTSLFILRSSDKVNLEDSLKAGKPIGGHFVLGHVDCVGAVSAIRNVSGEYCMEVSFPDEFSHLVVEKGSVSLDGISLTVGGAKKGRLSVYIIPHTLKMTNLHLKREGDKINMEFDIIGKYLARFRDLDKKGGVTENFLKQMGF